MFEPQQGLSVEELAQWAEYAEKAGYGYFFRSDHLLPMRSMRNVDETRGSTECWVTLAAIASRTRKIRFGPMVSPIGFRNPALLARMACTLHSYSRGRLVLSIGAGWYKREYLAHGYKFPRLKDRMHQLREAVAIIRPLSQGERVDYDGKFFSAHLACLPKPVGPIRLVIGGNSDAAMALACQYADELNVTKEFSITAKTHNELREGLQSLLVSREIDVSLMTPFLASDNSRELESRVKRYMKLTRMRGEVRNAMKELIARGVMCGTANEFSAQVKERLALGFKRIYFQILDPSDKAMVKTLTQILRAL
jgi:alkanesulfonate monooxygenase